MTITPERLCTLEKLSPGESGEIVTVDVGDEMSSFLEMGFFEGTRIKLVHLGPFGSDPIAVELRGTLVAIHRRDAQKITVNRLTL